MPIWKRNLIVCWFGMFVTGVGMSQLAPILPLYIKELGVDQADAVSRYSGLAFGITFIVSAIFSPIWGLAADKFGRKPMLLRASLGMAIIIGCMGFVTNVHMLIALRFLQGIITGYSTACTTLIATQTDKEHAGWALGLLSTSNIAGSLLGPTIGGFIAEHAGLQETFFLTGGLMLIAFIMTLLFVKETFVRSEVKVAGMKEVWGALPEKSLTVTLFATFFMLSVAMYSVEPVLTVYVNEISRNSSHVAMLAGMIFSASGLANIWAAPKLGKLSDRIGAHKVMLAALLVSGILFVPQAMARNPWELMGLRFLLGAAAGGLNPSVNTLIKKITPEHLTGRVFGLSMAAGYLGVFAGSVLGGQVAAWFGIPYVFLLTSVLLLINAAWVYAKVYKKLREPSHSAAL
ncbi:multidrug efflux MFS transporter [Paenibacillus phoenicis]|uniref:Multidrug efflux MFS transporter n=1 Tax=Paenibacillus phoenicis TaxID=554117 RepID=A0ABU5PIH9_9BACL|nr:MULTISPECIES: multidrug efflux MFS transporter [Paenibacillus]MCT2195452.1 multidrug efflux MFS transporter [Paenibacillus sp. p3-SID1389]MEA3569744.1 multidrug efflux MFS transporter [Paenibacillus phoenicis]